MNREELLDFVNQLPNKSWDRFLSGFFGPYDGAKDHDLTHLVFYWRELFHLLGGAVLGIFSLPFLALFTPKFMVIATFSVVSMTMLIKELVFDASEQVNGWDFKNFVDAMVWGVGASLPHVPFAVA